MTLRDSMMMKFMDRVIYFANENTIPLVTSDLASVGLGALAGYGSPEENIGRVAAEKVRHLFEKQLQPCEVPITKAECRYKFCINSSSAKNQLPELENEFKRQKRGAI